ncbi:hypothetical protein [Virgibacillus halodenitrificans]|nr:hypothetical protein [Virgibacillus halodenitrificans]
MLQSEDIGNKEKDLIYDLILNNANATLAIRDLCERRFDKYKCEIITGDKNGSY